MVVLVLDDTGGHAAKLFLLQVPVFVVVFQGQFFWADDFCAHVWNAQAAFFKAKIVSILIQENGIDKYAADAFFLLILIQHQGAVDDK